jgi:hypothetical protein
MGEERAHLSKCGLTFRECAAAKLRWGGVYPSAGTFVLDTGLHVDIKPEPQGYLSYLLRLWPSGRQGTRDLRIQLISTRTGDKASFQNLTDLTRFLEAELLKKFLKNPKGHEDP